MKTASPIALAPNLPPWVNSPHTLISLWDMIQFLAADFAHDWQWLLNEKNQAYLMAASKENTTPTSHDINRLNGLLKGDDRLICKGLLHFCQKLGMEKSHGRIEHFLMKLNVTNSTPNFHVVHSELLGIEHALWEEMRERNFQYIPLSKSKLFEQIALFGNSVNDAFPSAKSEIRYAGNCLAVELNTGAVYHLMRVMEIGLRVLHKTLIRKRPTNLNWNSLIEAIDRAIEAKDKIKPWPAAWKNKRQFYIESARHFFFFKDKRNRTVHVDLPFDDYPSPTSDQAFQIFDQIKSFMQHLATKVKE